MFQHRLLHLKVFARRLARLASRKARIAFTVALLTSLAVFALRYSAFSQQVPSLDPQAIMNHLNSVIQFYRGVSEPIQKAGEPNDVVYRDQAVAQATEIAGFAFQAAKAEGGLISSAQIASQGSPSTEESSREQRMKTTLATLDTRIANLEKRETAIDVQISAATRQSALSALQSQKKQVHAALDLSNALKDAIEKFASMTGAAKGTGFAASIERLQLSVPELQGKNKTSVPPLNTIGSAMSSGVTGQGRVLFELLETRHSIDNLIESNDTLHQQALDLRTPILNVLRTLVRQGQQLSEQAELAPPAAVPSGRPHQQAAPTAPAVPQPDLESIVAQFKSLSAATLPLSEEIVILEQSRANLTSWRSSVDNEYDSILQSLLLRIFVIAIALALIIGGGNLWTRATNKYVRDLRRRRQLLIVRRVVVGFLTVIVVLFGFVTQFNSLATFAGLITAGIAVGLQTILLSVAAYFFIIGRYGIKVGDRITIASVTGDVIDVGLVRFYLMELAGAGALLNPTGRVAVFSNAVLFQAGTPLYKQVPGTGYAWHELTVKLADAADPKLVNDAVMKEIHAVYEGYRPHIEYQHRTMQHWMQTSIAEPEIESRVQWAGGIFQLWVRFPVEIAHAAETDEKITHALLDLMASNPDIKGAVVATPSIQPSVRG